MEKLAQNAILAINDSGWFGYLYQNNVRNITVILEQNDTVFIANIECDQPSELEAKRSATGLNGILNIAMPTLKSDEKEFLSRANISSNGNIFQINFTIPKPLIQELIQRALEKAKQDAGNSATSDSPNYN